MELRKKEGVVLISKAKIQIFMLLLGSGFIINGVLRDEVSTVLSKAVKLCLECVGIG